MNNSITRKPNILTGKYCPTPTLTSIGDNILKIQRCIGDMGYDTSMISSTLNKIEYGVMPANLKSRFNAYDFRIWQLSQAVDYITDNALTTRYIWDNRPTDIRGQILRWFRWNNEQKEVIDNQLAGTQPLCDINGELTRDMNGDIIYVEVNING